MITRGMLQKEYIENKKSIRQIAEENRTYPQEIRRALLKYGFKIRNKSETQKLALEQGRAISPTQGKERDSETKSKISQTLKERHDGKTTEKRQ